MGGIGDAGNYGPDVAVLGMEGGRFIVFVEACGFVPQEEIGRCLYTCRVVRPSWNLG